MVIGMIGTLVTLGLIVWQFFESKKSGLLRIAREEYDDRLVRYEGRVTYLEGPFAGIKPGEEVYLSVLDGVICVTSKQRDLYALEESALLSVNTEAKGDRTVVHLQFHDDAEQQQLIVRTKPARAKNIAGVVR
jgi:hypothetical protein